MELLEIGLRDHKGVAEATKMGRVFQFFRKYVSTIDKSWYVLYANMSCDLCFAYTIFMEVDMFDTFRCDSR